MTAAGIRPWWGAAGAALLLGLGAAAWVMRGAWVAEPATELATLAPVVPCGPDSAGVEDVSALIDGAGDGTLDALRRSLAAVPPVVRAALARQRLTVSVDTSTTPLLCRAGPTAATDAAASGVEVCHQPSGAGSAPRLLFRVASVVDGDTAWRERGLYAAVIPAATHVFLSAVFATAPSGRVPHGAVDVAQTLLELQSRLAAALVRSDATLAHWQAQYGSAWASRQDAMERAVLHVTHRFYCSRASREALQAAAPDAAAMYARTFQCALGRPWYADEAEFAAACPKQG
jgi:hypothetical protein